MAIKLNNIIRYMKGGKYKVYEEPYRLNIVGVRNAESQPNKFDDTMFVFWKDENNDWQERQYPITTDTGTYWLLNPMNNQGTAMLKEGQYVDAYAQGYHRDSYKALVQVEPVTVYRDYDRNALFDIFTKTETGKFGINIHKAGDDSQNVDKWSAGCQVFQRTADFNDFMNLTDKHRDRYGNRFTYTLIDERAIRRRKRIVAFFVSIGAFVAVGISVGLYLRNKNKN